MIAPLDHGAYERQARRPHVWQAVDRRSTWVACLPSGLESPMRPVFPASILLEMDRGDNAVDDRCVTVHCPQSPSFRRLRRSAALTVDLSAYQSGIAMTWMMASRETDSSLGRLPLSLQVELAAAGKGRQVRQR